MIPIVQRLPGGRLLVPIRAESDDGTVGDALVEIGPDHPEHAAWELHAMTDRPSEGAIQAKNPVT